MNHISQEIPLSLATIYRSKMRTVRRVDRAYTAWLRTQPCARCGRFPVEVAHQRILLGGGMGMKPSDYDALPMCHGCHALEHSSGVAAVWGTGYHPKEVTRGLIYLECNKHVARYLSESGATAESMAEDMFQAAEVGA